MKEQFARSEAIFGAEAMEKLKNSRVAVFGIGGVGGYVVEALARGGIGALELIDSDEVSVTNLNRQLHALHSTVGMPKTEAAALRAKDINPEITVVTHQTFFLPENAAEFDFSTYDYIVDAVDTVAAKLALVMRAKEYGVPIISAMGAGNKLDATAFRVADIYKTSVCPLARIMRRELKLRGIRSLKVVYSEEEARKIDLSESEPSMGRHPPASTSFVPGVVGLILAGEVIKDLAAKPEH